ncbi:MAG: DUF6089 family protein [Saprospiraceae bacterium]
MRITYLFFLSLLAGVAFTGLQAQNLEGGLFGGIAAYSGDLSPKEFGLFFEDMEPAGGLFLRYNFNRRLSARFGGNFAKLSASREVPANADGELPVNVPNFRTDIIEANLNLELNLFFIGQEDGFRMAPFISGGVGVFSFDPEAELDGQFIKVQPLRTEGQGINDPRYPAAPYNLTQLNLQLGGGLKLMLNDRLTIGLELSGRRLGTDYLDDISDTNVNYQDILSNTGAIAARISNPAVIDPSTAPDLNYQRGGRYNDWYFISGISVAFSFGQGGGGGGGGKTGCYQF